MHHKPEKKFDVVIVGAGPAGLSLARSLAETGLQIAVIEKSPRKVLAQPPMDGREIALTHTSKFLLTALGVWQRFPENAVSLIRKARVLNGTSSYFLDFDHRETGKDTLGYVISNHLIREALFTAVAGYPDITVITDTEVTGLKTDADCARVILSGGQVIEASLAVAADSRFSNMRRHAGIGASMQDFGRTAIVCRMTHEAPHHDIAHECFQYGQTLAVLPLAGNVSSIVVTVPSDRADRIMEMDKAAFSGDIRQRFNGRLGHMELLGERFSYPLVAVYARRFAGNRFALVGDAAVGMHPVTAHGFNLGLKSQHTLALEIMAAAERGGDIGAYRGLERYQAKHRRASWPLYQGTNALVKLYTDETLPALALRNSLLRLGNIFTPGRHLIMRQLTDAPPQPAVSGSKAVPNLTENSHA